VEGPISLALGTCPLNILIVSPTVPWPTNNGARLRIAHLLKGLALHNNVTLVALASNNENIDVVTLASKNLKGCEIVRHKTSKLASIFRWSLSQKPYRNVKVAGCGLDSVICGKLAHHDFDVILCNFLETLEFIPDELVRPGRQKPLIVLDQHNADNLWFESFAKSSSIMLRYFGRENIRRLNRLQPYLYSKIDLCLCVSEEDLNYSFSLNRNASYILAPNGVAVQEFRSSSKPEKYDEVLFVGSLDVAMNQHAIRWFLRHIWPRIRTKHPSTRFIVVGRSPPPWLTALSGENNVVVHANVDTVIPYYQRAKVVVAPFELGGGTKLKVLEAFAAAVPVVATSVGVRGLPIRHLQHAFVDDTPEGFTHHVLSQLDQPDYSIVRRAYDLVEKQFSWDHIVHRVESALRDAIVSKNSIARSNG
jgi:polysaccharide biosynthesis protein PslH